MEYRRAKIDGGTFFFTVVTYERLKILTIPDNIELLRNAFKKVMKQHPFVIDAIAILPEHIHAIWTLPKDDRDFSTRWRLIKSYFSTQCQLVGRVDERNPPNRENVKPLIQIPESRFKKGEKAVWQRRFWEHFIRDNDDFNNHVNYIHFNPVKHGLVKSPKDWEHSSFYRYVHKGFYDEDWGSGSDMEFDNSVGYE